MATAVCTKEHQKYICTLFRRSLSLPLLTSQGLLCFISTLYFCSILILALSTTCEPEELVRILNDLFALFDKLANVSAINKYIILRPRCCIVVYAYKSAHGDASFLT